ncbi:MAG TPA: PRC-barrel domain-containing protein [Syntrophorhabdaceae bacterium]|nr:PRC-barrel domain-containing protein [Syntrophorhabdaceae bacterium]
MRYRKDAEVMTSGGKKIGEIDRVIVNPSTDAVTHIVVRKGFLFTSDRMISVDKIENTYKDKIVLKKGIEDVKELPEYREREYISALDDSGIEHETEYAPSMMWYYPTPGFGWWAEAPGYPVPPFVVKIEINIPEGTVPVSEGARVISEDGVEVGEVYLIYTEPKENRITHILLQKGILKKERKLIPSNWIKSVSEDEIQINVPEQVVKNLPEYEEPY